MVEIDTPAGLAYIQYTHDGLEEAQVVRILPGLHDERPSDLIERVKHHELYFTFYLIEYSFRKGLVKIVSNEPIPDWAVNPPMMRLAVGWDPDLALVPRWRIVNAATQLTLEELSRTILLSKLTEEEEKLSVREIWPHEVMVRQFTRGWTPSRSAEFTTLDASAKARELARTPDDEGLMQRYLYFPTIKGANDAAERLLELGYVAEIEAGKINREWLALAKNARPRNSEEMEKTRDELEALATAFGGAYDGWDLAVPIKTPKVTCRSL